MKIRLPITLTPKQKEIEESRARFKVVKGGRRGGKTRYGSYWLGKRALTVPGKHWYVCQNLDLIRDEMWPRLCELLRDYITKKDDRLYRMDVSNGMFKAQISCKSAVMENALRGRGLASLELDEASFVRPRMWDMILRPMLADTEGPALIMSSAKKGWFTQTFNYAQKAEDPDWQAFHMTIYDNPHIARQEIEQIKRSTPVDVWKQEYMGEEASNQGMVYAEYSDKTAYDPAVRFQGTPSFPTVVGLDWGFAANTAAVWLHASPEGYLIASREHARRGWDVVRHSSVIKSVSSTIAYPNIEYVLDSSAFRKEGTSGLSIADQFRTAGIYCRRDDRDVMGSINLVKQFMRGDGEKPWMFISTDCPLLISAIQEWEWDEHEPDVLVALRYAVAHMVKRGFTPLSSKFPGYVEPIDKSPEEMVRELMARQQVRVRRPARSVQWAWDSEAGAPG